MQKSIGGRLKEERERLGLSQQAMGEIGGVKKLAQFNYEKGDRYPDAMYLSNVARFGVDVQYVVTGEHSVAAMTSDESELLESYRAAPLTVKAAAIGALSGGSNVAHGVANFTVSGGSGTRIAGQNIITNHNTNKK